MPTNDLLIPVWISVTFTESADWHARLRISANNDESLAITVIHESVVGIVERDLAGNAMIDALAVQNGETLTILVRNDHGEIIACGVYEVDLSLIERLSAILRPTIASGLLVDQCPQHVVDSSVQRALATLRPASTAELAQPEIAQVL